MQKQLSTNLRRVISGRCRFVLSMVEKAMTKEQFEQELLAMDNVPIFYMFDGPKFEENQIVVLFFANTNVTGFVREHPGDCSYNSDNILCYQGIHFWNVKTK